ncbi:MAG: DUF3107 domain-containing protein [Mycobacterium sp.]
MEVKIGVADSPRELAFVSAETPDALEKQVTSALSQADGVLTLLDEKGRRFIIQAAKIAYIELGPADSRRVGFGIGSGPVTPPVTTE